MSFYLVKQLITYGNKLSTNRLALLDALPVDATADANAISAAIDGVTLGTPAQVILSEDAILSVGSKVPPADKTAQRGAKWLIKTWDAVAGKGGSFEIATADHSLIQDQTETMDLTAGPGLALKTALEAGGMSSYGNAIEVVSVTFVNRNIQ